MQIICNDHAHLVPRPLYSMQDGWFIQTPLNPLLHPGKRGGGGSFAPLDLPLDPPVIYSWLFFPFSFIAVECNTLVTTSTSSLMALLRSLAAYLIVLVDYALPLIMTIVHLSIKRWCISYVTFCNTCVTIMYNCMCAGMCYCDN